MKKMLRFIDPTRIIYELFAPCPHHLPQAGEGWGGGMRLIFNSCRINKLAVLMLLAALTVACSAPRVQEPAIYDFGSLRPLPVGVSVSVLPPVSVADVNAPVWLDSTRMVYRLAYANDQQMRSYANSRWSMPPARLFEQRLKARIAQSGGTVLSQTDGASNLPLIRIDAEDFTQFFSSTSDSKAQVTIRVSILRGRSLIAQQTFSHQSAAPTPDAVGGAIALAVASDAVISDVMSWLAGQLLK